MTMTTLLQTILLIGLTVVFYNYFLKVRQYVLDQKLASQKMEADINELKAANIKLSAHLEQSFARSEIVMDHTKMEAELKELKEQHVRLCGFARQKIDLMEIDQMQILKYLLEAHRLNAHFAKTKAQGLDNIYRRYILEHRWSQHCFGEVSDQESDESEDEQSDKSEDEESGKRKYENPDDSEESDDSDSEDW